jgi:uncharacterized protein YgiM (DUF1202 family)
VSVAKIVRAAIGLAIVVILGFVVMGWWNDFKSAPPTPAASPTVSTTPTSTVSTTTVTGIGIARIDGVNFRTKPASNAKLIRGLKKGEKVTILLKDGAWYKVKDSKNKTGWVTANGDYVTLQEN